MIGISDILAPDSGGICFVQDDPVEEGIAEVKPKSLRQEWAEQRQDHAVFKKGAQVRVACENLMHKLRYSQIGKVFGHVDGEVCVQLQASLALVVMLEARVVAPGMVT